MKESHNPHCWYHYWRVQTGGFYCNKNHQNHHRNKQSGQNLIYGVKIRSLSIIHLVDCMITYHIIGTTTVASNNNYHHRPRRWVGNGNAMIYYWAKIGTYGIQSQSRLHPSMTATTRYRTPRKPNHCKVGWYNCNNRNWKVSLRNVTRKLPIYCSSNETRRMVQQRNCYQHHHQQYLTTRRI